MKRLKAYSLVEMLVAIGMFGLVASSIIFISVDIFSTLFDFQKKVRSDIYRDKIVKQITQIKHESWATILQNTKSTPMYIAENANGYSIEDGTFVLNDLTYSFTITQAYRDSNGNISESGTVDPHTRNVEINFSWEDRLGRIQNYNSNFYINDWNTKTWAVTSQNDFDAGSFTNTISTNSSGGEVQLETVIYSDWCKPENTNYSFNLSGQGVANTISADPGRAFIGTGNNASGLSFIRTDITHTLPPTTTTHGTFDGYKVNDSFGVGNYAYLATDTNSKEVVILDISQTPYQEVGYFNAPGNGDGTSIVVSGNTGFLATSNSVYLINLTSNIGSRPQLGSVINIGGTVAYLHVEDTFLYVANSSTTQLKIIDFTNPSSASIVGTAQVDGNSATGVFTDENITYLVTSSNSTKNELFLIDVSTKTGVRPVISSADTNGMSPMSVTKVDDGRVVVVGTSGIEYQVFNTLNQQSPVKCGELNIDSGVFDSVGVKLQNGDTYSYIVTGDSNNELRVIRGGAGGGGVGGNGYAPQGTYTSEVFDSESANTNYLHLEWDQDLPSNTGVTFQLRSGSSTDLSGQTFIGPDGTSNTYFTDSISSYLDSYLNNQRYLQFRVYMTSDTVNTPILNSVNINYAK